MQEIGTTKPQKPLHPVVAVTLGWVLILGGTAGLFLPILPGVVLLFAGAGMLSTKSTLLQHVLEKCRVRFPFLERTFKRPAA
jgi:uncharacterized membrane protein YbaN (DUF454 family)